jgi:hypothetical protein
MSKLDSGLYTAAAVSVVFFALQSWSFVYLSEASSIEPVPDHIYELLEEWREGTRPLSSPEKIVDDYEGLIELLEDSGELISESADPLIWSATGYAILAILGLRNIFLNRRSNAA